MKSIQFGDILSAPRGIIVHGCNAQGVMGSGIAKDVKAQFPGAYLAYTQHLDKTTNPLGTVAFYDVPGTDLTIANAITQRTFGRGGQRFVDYRAIQTAFDTIIRVAQRAPIPRAVHYPQIGAGLGGGDWSLISEIIDNCFERASPGLLRTLWIYEP